MMGWLIALGVVSALILGLSYYGSVETTRIAYLPVPFFPEDFGWAYERVSFKSFDGLTLTGWFVPADSPSEFTVMVQHGLASNAGDMLSNTACLRNGGKWNLFYYNFRGHADSQGQRTSLGPLELRDMESALKWLKDNKSKESRRLAVYGHSLGAAVAIVAAGSHPEIEGVAAESPFAFISNTVRHFAWTFYRLPYFPFVPLSLFFTSLRLGMRIGDFAPAESIGQIAPRPIYLIAAEKDRRMPMSDAKILWENAREPKEQWVVPDAGHGEPWIMYREEYERRLMGFFEKVFSTHCPPADRKPGSISGMTSTKGIL